MRILLKEKELPGMSSTHVPKHRVLEPLAVEASSGFAMERMLRSGLGRTMRPKARHRTGLTTSALLNPHEPRTRIRFGVRIYQFMASAMARSNASNGSPPW